MLTGFWLASEMSYNVSQFKSPEASSAFRRGNEEGRESRGLSIGDAE